MGNPIFLSNPVMMAWTSGTVFGLLTHLPEDVTGGAGSNTIQVGNIVELNITGKLVDGNCYPLL